MIKIAGMTRIRNEEYIIQDTLDHYAKFCNHGIFVYDDCSTDSTPDICEAHPAVVDVMRNEKWDTTITGRWKAEGSHRQIIHGRTRATKPDWIWYFDADERVEFDFENFDYDSWDCVILKLFDFYITPEDVDKHWSERKWIGPEYRNIPMFFRNVPELFFSNRAPKMPPTWRMFRDGYVKHYSKAISVEHWNETCEYYTTYFDEPYKSKWELRKGRAVHDGVSDFGNPLVRWEDKEKFGFVLSNKDRLREQLGITQSGLAIQW